jgi:VIT1/CCC1 family predicted Fe2+/Mn2+ transporter
MKRQTRLLPETQQMHKQEQEKARELEFGGALAIATIILQGLLSYPSFDAYLTGAIVCLTIALPCLASVFVAKARLQRVSKWARIRGTCGMSLAVTGITFVLFHYAYWLGILFFLVSCTVYVMAALGY